MRLTQNTFHAETKDGDRSGIRPLEIRESVAQLLATRIESQLIRVGS
jgi:hypothetical protein